MLWLVESSLFIEPEHSATTNPKSSRVYGRNLNSISQSPHSRGIPCPQSSQLKQSGRQICSRSYDLERKCSISFVKRCTSDSPALGYFGHGNRVPHESRERTFSLLLINNNNRHKKDTTYRLISYLRFATISRGWEVEWNRKGRTRFPPDTKETRLIRHKSERFLGDWSGQSANGGKACHTRTCNIEFAKAVLTK